MTQTQAAPGWYPNSDGGQSFWDGQQYTHHHYPQLALGKVTSPIVGWVLTVAGGLVFVGAFLPWATALGGVISKAGTDGDGIVTLLLGVGLAALGVAIGIKQGMLWVPLVGVVFALAVIGVAAWDAHDVTQNRVGVSIGAGLWLTIAAGVLALALSVVGLFTREPA